MKEYKKVVQGELYLPPSVISDPEIAEIVSISEKLKRQGLGNRILKDYLVAQKRYNLVRKYENILQSEDCTTEEALYIISEKKKNDIYAFFQEYIKQSINERRDISETVKYISSISSVFSPSTKKSISSMTDSFLAYLHEAEGNRLKTGIKEFDDNIWIEEDRFIVVGGGSGSGKTTMILNLIRWLCMNHKEDIEIMFLSLEMSENRIIEKLFSSLLLKPVKDLRKDPESYSNELLDAKIEVDSWPLHIHYTGTEIEEMERITTSFLSEVKSSSKIPLVIVDHIGEVEGGSLTEGKQLTDAVTRLLKNLCRQGGISIALTQLRKDLEDPKYKANLHQPSDSFIMNSQLVKARADIILHTWRPEVYGVKDWQQEVMVKGGSEIYDWDLENTMFLCNTKNRDDSFKIIPLNSYMAVNYIEEFNYSKKQIIR